MPGLLVCVNHAAPFHVGGSEKVVQQIVRSMKWKHNIDCHILTKFTYQQKTIHDGVVIERCAQTSEDFLEQVRSIDADYLLTYSDCFSHWSTLLREAEKIRCKQSIALVGMNDMIHDQNMKSMFFNKNHLFRVITHSDNYQDYRYCSEKKIPVHVIPNGIDLDEFKDQNFSFREKYEITTPKMTLCVSNFFPGKGQDHLLHVLNKVAEKNKDFTAVFISSKVSFFVANNLMQRFEIMLKRFAKFKYVFLRDIPRRDTIQAFREADVFTFPSQQEVAPLVVLEAMATRTPWVSLSVGNVPTLHGGIVIPAVKKIRDQYQYDEEMYQQFANGVQQILSNSNLAKTLADEGYKQIESELNWDLIQEQYRKVITS